MSMMLSCGTLCLCMNLMVYVGVTLLLILCANHPNSFTANGFRASLNFRCLNNWWYSRSSPVLWSNMAWACLWHQLATILQCCCLMAFPEHDIVDTRWNTVGSLGGAVDGDIAKMGGNATTNQSCASMSGGLGTGTRVCTLWNGAGMIGFSSIETRVGMVGSSTLGCCARGCWMVSSGCNMFYMCLSASVCMLPWKLLMPWIGFIKSLHALMIQSAAVTGGWVNYLCLKNTKSVMHMQHDVTAVCSGKVCRYHPAPECSPHVHCWAGLMWNWTAQPTGAIDMQL